MWLNFGRLSEQSPLSKSVTKFSTLVQVAIGLVQGVQLNFNHPNEWSPLSKHATEILHLCPNNDWPYLRNEIEFWLARQWSLLSKSVGWNLVILWTSCNQKFGRIKTMGKCIRNQFKFQFFDIVEPKYKLATTILLYHLFHLSLFATWVPSLWLFFGI